MSRYIPAFPTAYNASAGMAMRDWFAGQALVGLLSGQNRDNGQQNLSGVPAEAYDIADAMMAERERRQGGVA